MDNITIEEIKKLKDRLEDDIVKLIKRFEEDTKLPISVLDYNRCKHPNKCSGGDFIHHKIKCEIKI